MIRGKCFLVTGVFRNLCDGSAICNCLQLAHQSQQPFIIQDLLIEKSIENLAGTSYTSFPNTTGAMLLRGLKSNELLVATNLHEYTVRSTFECRCTIPSHHSHNWSHYQSSSTQACSVSSFLIREFKIPGQLI